MQKNKVKKEGLKTKNNIIAKKQFGLQMLKVPSELCGHPASFSVNPPQQINLFIFFAKNINLLVLSKMNQIGSTIHRLYG
jgi:hypothetical protein